MMSSFLDAAKQLLRLNICRAPDACSPDSGIASKFAWLGYDAVRSACAELSSDPYTTKYHVTRPNAELQALVSADHMFLCDFRVLALCQHWAIMRQSTCSVRCGHAICYRAGDTCILWPV